MKSTILVLGLVFAVGAFAKEARFTCAAKAYNCHTHNGDTDCRWHSLDAIDFEVPMREGEDMFGNPKWSGRFQSSIDNHYLTVNIVQTFSQDGAYLSLKAKLDAGNVVSETSGEEKIDVSLRNDRFGRGYTCWDFHVVD
jgi:hypothetical protein